MATPMERARIIHRAINAYFTMLDHIHELVRHQQMQCLHPEQLAFQMTIQHQDADIIAAFNELISRGGLTPVESTEYRDKQLRQDLIASTLSKLA